MQSLNTFSETISARHSIQNVDVAHFVREYHFCREHPSVYSSQQLSSGVLSETLSFNPCSVAAHLSWFRVIIALYSAVFRVRNSSSSNRRKMAIYTRGRCAGSLRDYFPRSIPFQLILFLSPNALKLIELFRDIKTISTGRYFVGDIRNFAI